MHRLLSLFVLLSGSTALAEAPIVDQRPSLHVTGVASASVAPDKVDLILTVSSEADTVEQAMKTNESRMAALQSVVSSAGIAPADLQLSTVAVAPREEYDRDNRPKGVRYTVTKVLFLCLRNLPRLDSLLVSLSKAQVLVTSIEFASDKLKAMEPALQVKAVENARQRAEAMAAPLGARVGRALRVRAAARPESRSMNAYSSSAGSSVGGTATGALNLELAMEVDFELTDAAGK